MEYDIGHTNTQKLIGIVQDLHWMAQRYADGRMSYVPKLFNDHTDTLTRIGIPLRPVDGSLYAADGMGRDFDGLDDSQARLAAISAAEQRLALCVSIYIETNLDGNTSSLPPFLQDAYTKWKRAEQGE